jgi:RNA polymerase sigma-70 factor (ECF subfamily)
MLPSTRQSTDSRLERARQGSRSALNRLLASCRARLLRKAKAVPGWKQDASDLVQECLFLATERIGEFKGLSPGEFRAWIGKILENRILQHQRHWVRKKRDRKRQVPLESAGTEPDEPAASTTSILSRLARQDEWEQLKVAVGWCREEEQDVIRKRLWEDRSHEEIAAELEVSPAVVRQRFSRAIRRLGHGLRLQELMTWHGFSAKKQNAIGIHHLQRVDARTIAGRLQLEDRLVALWLADARPLIRELDEEKP